MIQSVRLRLALWHTAALGVLLVAFAAVAYGYLARSGRERVDRSIADAAGAFVTEAIADRAEQRREPGEDPGAIAGVMETARDFRMGNTRTFVFDSTTRLAAATPVDPRARVAPDSLVMRAVLGVRPGAPAARFAIPGNDGGYRGFATHVDLDGQRLTVASVASLHELDESLEGVRNAFSLWIPIALLLAGMGGYLLARRSLAPVLLMSEAAARMGAESPDERLPVPNPHDELGHLATVLNGLLDRLGAAISQQRRFMADAAHELRTPVAIVRSEADVALSREDRSLEEYRESLVVVREEGRRLSRVVDDVFLLARADGGRHPLHPTELYLNELASECVRSLRSLAAARDIALRCDAPEDAPFHGDQALLHRLLLNLVDNAIKYSPPGSLVEITLRREGGEYRLSVRDPGAPIADGVRARIFERFFRDGAAAAGGGAGLGLAIARWVAEAHGGTLVLAQNEGAGNEFVLRLPLPDKDSLP
jgi:two-component system OmpR family sensor kinase